jgi:CubicO group peptidase (beta-lactamase class C family)
MRRWVLLSAALLALVSAVAVHVDDPAARLIGLWGDELTFGPAVRGELTVDGRDPWQARVGGYEVAVQHEKDAVAFVLPSKQGEFRGRLQTDGGITGSWIQPATVTGGTRYASPVALSPIGARLWRGQIEPLREQFSLYLVIQKAKDGSLQAFIRNPERNFGMRRAYAVSGSPDHLLLDDTLRKGDRVTGSYDSGTDRLTLALPDLGGLIFTRRGRDSAPGFYPVPPAVDHYVYRSPVGEDDGWRTASLAEAGLDPRPLNALVQQILDTRTDWFTTPYIQGLLIARHGKLAMEEYFYGFDKQRPHDTRSAGKTLAGTLIGIALDHGATFGLDTSVYSLFPEYKGFANPDPRKQKMSVRDLLSMNSGLACDDNDDRSPGNEDTMQSQDAQPDWYKYTLDLPMAYEPGNGSAVYCTAGVNLLGGVLRDATGMSVVDFFQRYYAAPLDIRSYHMNLSPLGDGYLGGGIYMRPRDFLKLGQLYLDGGRWNGRQVVSEAWTRAATERHAYFPASDNAPGHGYGYTWHLFQVTVGGHTYDEYLAQGNGGQLVMVVPELDLAVLITAGNYGNFPTWRKYFETLLPQYIIPAALH